MRRLSNGSLLIDELAVVLVFPVEGAVSMLLTGAVTDHDAARVISGRRGSELFLLNEALTILGYPIDVDDMPESPE